MMGALRRPMLLAATAGLVAAGDVVPGSGVPEAALLPRHDAIAWRTAGEGLRWASVPLGLPGYDGPSVRMVLARLDPARHRLTLQARLRAYHTKPGWTVDEAPETAVLALNAGQFTGIAPWGWLVMDGEEVRPPGVGPLSVAVVADTAGRVTWLRPDEIESRRTAGDLAWAFQSYPTLLLNGVIPRPLREAGLGVDLAHRDARLALCELPTGELLVALTRWSGLGEAAGSVPFGLTVPETAEAMRSLGCVTAVALDGGISAQLLIRSDDGRTRAWRGWRKVPVGLVAARR